jgi:hypothetical protein
MRDWITALFAILGSLFVLAGGTISVLKTIAPARVDDTADTAVGNPIVKRFRHLNAPDRLVLWGVLLLFLAAIAAGAISFNFGAEAGTR